MAKTEGWGESEVELRDSLTVRSRESEVTEKKLLFKLIPNAFIY